MHATYATTKTGIDVLLKQPHRLRGRKIGFITNPTGVTHNLRSTAEALDSLRGVTLRALFAPEHGMRGEVQDGFGVEAMTPQHPS